MRVGFGVKRLGPSPEAKGVRRSLLDRLAALQEQRLETHLREDEGAEIAAGTGADHHRPRGGLASGADLAHEAIAGVAGRLQVRVTLEAFEQLALEFRLEFQLQAVGDLNRRLTPGIHAFFDHAVHEQRRRIDLEAFADGWSEIRLLVVERQFQLAQSQHHRF